MRTARCLAAILATALLGGCDSHYVFDTVALHRWGHGAYDWLLPDEPERPR